MVSVGVYFLVRAREGRLIGLEKNLQCDVHFARVAQFHIEYISSLCSLLPIFLGYLRGNVRSNGSYDVRSS